MKPDGRPDLKEMGYYISLAQVGLEMVFPMVIGIIVDYYLHSSPWGTVIGFAFGFIGGFAHLLTLLNRQNDSESSKPEKNGK